MLSPTTIQIIKSTVPVLEVHGTAITKRFYTQMFAEHPELLNIFNHANQKQGRQQTALANAVYAAAQHIDNLAAILPSVKQIAHKHRSLGVLPEHYPIVGKHLLKAIKDELGDAATPEILEAWAEAYGVIASAFIDTEQAMYEEAAAQPGGWDGFRAFRIERKVIESELIASFYLVPEDGGPLADFIPGQYVSIRIRPEGAVNTHIRQYSLSDAPGKPYYRISVKREEPIGELPAGQVSCFLHEAADAGDVLWLSAPAGDFVLEADDRRPLVLIAGGVGITPLMSMLNHLVESGSERPITLIQSVRHSGVQAWRERTEALAAAGRIRVYTCYDQPSEQDRASGRAYREGRIDAAWLKEVLPTEPATCYVCGPEPFMRAVYQGLLGNGVARESIRYEYFGPMGSLELEEASASVGSRA